MALIQLIYMSSTNYPFSERELVQLLEEARERNEQQNITGLLLYKRGRFMQILEGEEEQVVRLYETIKKDTRHYQIITLAKTAIDERMFGDWKMGFVNLQSLKSENIPGYADFLNRTFDLKTLVPDTSLAYKFLNIFRAYIH